MHPYAATFPKGSRAQIVSLRTLEDFQRSWRLHHPLDPEQLAYAGQTAVVADVGYYHGGDVLYQFEQVPGTWHECCLEMPLD